MSEDDDQPKVEHTRYSYSVKLVNRSKKSEYRIHNIRDGVKFTDMENLQGFIRTRFKEFTGCDELCIGYVEPGHGWKGKQMWLNSDEDIKDLYVVCSKARHILLWCYLPTEKKRKRKLEFSEEKENKRARCLSSNRSKIDETNDTFQDLITKHNHKYTPEQLHAWAEMVQMKKHSSLEVPPKMPFFRSRHQEPRAQEKVTTAVSSSGSSWIHARTECIEQLEKIGNLLEKGTISQEQHDKLQEAIMKDIL